MRLLKNGMIIGKAKVIVDIVAKGNFEIRPGYAMTPSEIAIHNTGNKGRGANAKAHNTYIHNMAELPASATGYASWQYSVDAYYIYQHIPNNESAWHTGDGDGPKSGNRNALGIEICENRDMTPQEYAQAEENAVQLAAYLMKLFSIPIIKVKPHQLYSGKYCPRVILDRDGSFYKFNARINKAFNFKPAAQKPATVAQVSKPVIKEEEITLSQLLTLTTGEGRNAILRVLRRFEKKDPALGKLWRDKVNNGTFTQNDSHEVLWVAIDRGYITGKTE